MRQHQGARHPCLIQHVPQTHGTHLEAADLLFHDIKSIPQVPPVPKLHAWRQQASASSSEMVEIALSQPIIRRCLRDPC